MPEKGVTTDKVLFAFIVMAAQGESEIRGEELTATVTRLQTMCIASLLRDDSGRAREKVLQQFQRLWAIHEERDPTLNPWGE